MVEKVADEYFKNLMQISEISLVYHNKVKFSDRYKIRVSNDAYMAFLRTWDHGKLELQEQFKVLLLDRGNSCIGLSTIATGGVANCLVDIKIAFAFAVKARATSMILAHNHPSGNLAPSEHDKSLTRRFATAGEILDIRVVDHLIVTKDGYTSFSDEGICSHNPKSDKNFDFLMYANSP